MQLFDVYAEVRVPARRVRAVSGGRAHPRLVVAQRSAPPSNIDTPSKSSSRPDRIRPSVKVAYQRGAVGP